MIYFYIQKPYFTVIYIYPAIICILLISLGIFMARFWSFLILLALLTLVGGAIYLMFAPIEAPKEHIEKTLPDKNFPK